MACSPQGMAPSLARHILKFELSYPNLIESLILEIQVGEELWNLSNKGKNWEEFGNG